MRRIIGIATVMLLAVPAFGQPTLATLCPEEDAPTEAEYANDPKAWADDFCALVWHEPRKATAQLGKMIATTRARLNSNRFYFPFSNTEPLQVLRPGMEDWRVVRWGTSVFTPRWSLTPNVPMGRDTTKTEYLRLGAGSASDYRNNREWVVSLGDHLSGHVQRGAIPVGVERAYYDCDREDGKRCYLTFTRMDEAQVRCVVPSLLDAWIAGEIVVHPPSGSHLAGDPNNREWGPNGFVATGLFWTGWTLCPSLIPTPVDQ